VGEIDAHITGDIFFGGRRTVTAGGCSHGWAQQRLGRAGGPHALLGGGAGRACAGPWEGVGFAGRGSRVARELGARWGGESRLEGVNRRNLKFINLNLH
jgi:hypothetical protein